MDRKTKEGANLLSRHCGCEAVAPFFWVGGGCRRDIRRRVFFSLPRAWLGKKVKGAPLGPEGEVKLHSRSHHIP